MTPSRPDGPPPPRPLPSETRPTLGFQQHLGPRFSSAELTIEAVADHSGVTVSCGDPTFERSDYFVATLPGIIKAMASLQAMNTRIHIVRALVDDVDSSPMAFEKCAFQAVIALAGLKTSHLPKQ